MKYILLFGFLTGAIAQSYDWDNETPWETIQGKQVPRYTNVSMTLGWIGIQRPEYDAKAFSLNGRT